MTMRPYPSRRTRNWWLLRPAIAVALLSVFAEIASGQAVRARTKSGTFGTPELPAALSITLQFIEPSGNAALDAGERGTLSVAVLNGGGTTARGVVARIETAAPVPGVTFPTAVRVGDVGPGQTGTARFPLNASEDVRQGSILFSVEAIDSLGVRADARSITVVVKEKVIVRDEMPPRIELLEPIAASTRGMRLAIEDTTFSTQSSSIVVRGIATDESGVALVLVNDHEARLSLSPQGTEFTSDVLLVLGANEIDIKAVDRHRNENLLRIIIFRQPVVVEEKKIQRKSLYRGQRWAVVVGISDYKSPDIPDLRYADRDAEGFHEILTTPLEQGGLDIPRTNVRFLLNDRATSKNVREALTDFLKNAIEDDMVFIYFAGHGAPDPDRPKVLYLLTYDSDLNALASTSIRMQEVQDALRDYCAAKTVLVFADACHSRGVTGALATRALASPQLVNEYLAELARARSSTLTFSASDVDQLSQEDRRWGGGHGVFTYYLLQGLQGKADLNGDGLVRLGELTQYVSDNVRRDTKAQQSPIPSGSPDINLPLTIVVER